MKNKNLMPLTLVFCLFFLWAISSNLLPTMIRQLMKTCELNPFQASFTESAYWLAYFVCPIPIAMILKRWGYKTGIVMGLLFAAFGCLLFLPGTAIRKYWFYLTIFFIIATGMCFLETAANPYVTVLGNPSTASKRLTLAQSFNSLGAFISAMFLSKLILNGHQYTRATLPASYPGGWDGLLRDEACAMRPPYITLAVVLIVMALVFICCRLPKIKENGGKLIDMAVLKRSHLRWGVIAQFFYNGGQTAINSLFLVYCCIYVGIDESKATTLFGFYMLAFLLGRWSGSWLLGKFAPHKLLTFYATMCALLSLVVIIFGGWTGLYAMIGISFFMSIIYPTQFSLALSDLGDDTKSGSAFLVMSIIGNACLPQLSAYVMNAHPAHYHFAYFIPMVCFGFCVLYGLKKYKVIHSN